MDNNHLLVILESVITGGCFTGAFIYFSNYKITRTHVNAADVLWNMNYKYRKFVNFFNVITNRVHIHGSIISVWSCIIDIYIVFCSRHAFGA